MVLFLLFFSCSTPPTECIENTTEPACNDDSLSDFENGLLADAIAEIREGIVPFSESGFGICEGVQKCERFLGATPGLLAEGDHLVHAELKVPDYGEGWTVNFVHQCNVAGENTNQMPANVWSKSYNVKNSGPNRGYRVSPLIRIKSPHPSGARTCTYSLTPVRPDGKELPAHQGSYETPASIQSD